MKTKPQSLQWQQLEQHTREKLQRNTVLIFPNGPGGDDFVSIRVEPTEMELMNFKRNIVPEPFGLKPVRLIKDKENWMVQD